MGKNTHHRETNARAFVADLNLLVGATLVI